MFSRCHESFEDNSHTGLRTQKTLYFDGFMDLVNVQKSNSSFSFLVFSQDSSLFKVKVHGWMAGEEKVSELLWGTKISCCNHRWSEPKGFKTWLIFNLLQLLLFDSAIQKRQRRRGKVCLRCWKMLMGFALCKRQKMCPCGLQIQQITLKKCEAEESPLALNIQLSIHIPFGNFSEHLTGC